MSHLKLATPIQLSNVPTLPSSAIAPPRHPSIDSSAEDERLLAAVELKNADALARLFDRHGAAVLGLLTRMLGRHGEAEEVLQEVFLWVWQNPGRYDGRRSSLRGWLLVLARSRALDVLRSDRSRRLREEGVAKERPGTCEPVPLASLEEREHRRRIAAAMATLPVEQRRCIELAFFGGLSHTQVAARLDEPLGTIKSRIQLGMAKLRLALRPAHSLTAAARTAAP
jgi:RNA polymerase sigma-70 factor (ECF subfamily)